jgi:hypothetical protein
VLAQSIGERVQERRAVRGLAAACKLQGRYQEAIGYYERVLLISQAMGEFTGRCCVPGFVEQQRSTKSSRGASVSGVLGVAGF